jgi:GNAT superfamily N-acetyltransferase
MLRNGRNKLELDGWTLEPIGVNDDKNILSFFDCGDCDLNEYFREQALKNKAALIGQPYFLYYSDIDTVPVALIDLCNDAVRKESSKRHPGYRDVADIEDEKQYPFLPAVKISRFGVAKEFQGDHIGSHVLNMIKKLFITENRTGCRFLTVDAYNKPDVISFYEKNDFKFFYEGDAEKKQRSMFYDLMRLLID